MYDIFLCCCMLSTVLFSKRKDMTLLGTYVYVPLEIFFGFVAMVNLALFLLLSFVRSIQSNVQFWVNDWCYWEHHSGFSICVVDCDIFQSNWNQQALYAAMSVPITKFSVSHGVYSKTCAYVTSLHGTLKGRYVPAIYRVFLVSLLLCRVLLMFSMYYEMYSSIWFFWSQLSSLRPGSC